ncbi:MAG TPA: glycoside hydrolase family 5 protein [Bacteroidetes bacterium]|nr:glycoside hydrolase family 5 protein [Bacteroidota bacterium]
MKIHHLILIVLFLLVGCQNNKDLPSSVFIRVDGPDLVAPGGEKFFIRGTNLGNWLNPEGYMFGFGKTNSAGRINQAFCEMVGPDFTAEFWQLFKDNYITGEDILFLKSTGVNSLRVPFHYKLFTDEDYMGLTVAQDGFERLDRLIGWCREAGIYLILDMHDAPGGQTGDNIDDSYGYPWLFESEKSQKLFIDIWVKIARYYKNEPVILGYDLLNEPIAPYFENIDELNAELEPLYKKAVAAIREVDMNHVILLGGAQWNSNFDVFTDASFDDNLMYTCHRYGGEPTAEAIKEFIEFRDKVNRPMYMGETGHNTEEWMSTFRKTMEENNIGWHFWPYKKLGGSSFVSITVPENWELVVDFVESNRNTYQAIREARPDQQLAKKAMLDFAENCKFEHCTINESYVRALGLDPEY